MSLRTWMTAAVMPYRAAWRRWREHRAYVDSLDDEARQVHERKQAVLQAHLAYAAQCRAGWTPRPTGRMTRQNALWSGTPPAADEPPLVRVRFHEPALRPDGQRRCRVCGYAGATEAVHAHVVRAGHNS